MIRELETEAERRRAIPVLRQLWTDADPADVLAWTGADDYHLFGRLADDALVGVAGVQLGNHLHHVRHAWLYDLVVDEPERGRGHGTALVEHVEDWARANDCEAVALASPADREAVHDYYRARGYEVWGHVVEKRLGGRS